MSKIKKSEYIKYSRTLVRKLYSTGCWGKGSMYEDNLLDGLPDKTIGRKVLNALIKQRIIIGKKKKYGHKYYLNTARMDKAREIVKEQGNKSIIPILLMI
jgi:hypothetical protein